VTTPGHIGTTTDHDVILVGGGLANGLIADRLTALRPELRILVLEIGPVLGGNHTWSFHDTDVSAQSHRWLTPYVAHRWTRQEVRFRRHTRLLETGYISAPSDLFHATLSQRLGNRLSLRTPVDDIDAGSVTLAGGQRITAACVIDGRGPRPDANLALGFQKFLGLEVETVRPHGRTHPIIMDATVPQTDGYRFMYTLPLSPTRLLIEDTYYSDGDDLAPDALRRDIEAYAAASGWGIASVVREEQGILPIVLAGDIERFWQSDRGVPRVGLRAALFHPTTGYSLPDAVGLAEAVATAPIVTSAAIAEMIRARSIALWRQRSFFRLLNRMLFVAAAPQERATVMERFYTLPEPLVRRFYAAQLTLADQARIVTGRPPVNILRAIGSMPPQAGWRFAQPGLRRATS
jgi:lycopene beta-cyclase